jgi:plastocyanin
VRRLIVALALTGAAALGASQALGASEPITTSTACCFGKASFTIDQGTVATFQNLDPGASPHNVTAVDSGANGKPLFSSATINIGQTPVQGTDSLAPGTYRFFCTVHPTQMSGELVVAGSGSPGVAVKILSRNLAGVVSSRQLKVKLRAVTARKGTRKLGSERGIDLSAGASRTVRLPLSRAGRNFLKNLRTAKVKVTATVPGGKPVSATRLLR